MTGYRMLMRHHMLMRAATAIVVMAALAAPTPAHAQFGRLIKKAKSKIAGENGPATAPGGARTGASGFGMPTFDSEIIELTPPVLDRMVRGMTAEVASLRASAAKRKVLSDSIVAVNEELDQLYKAHSGEDKQKWQDSYNAVENCQSEARDRLQEEHTPELQQRMMSDPSMQKKIMEITRKAAAARQEGDTLGATKLMTEIAAVANPYMKQDSATARKECGELPGKPAWMLRENTLSELESDLANRLRELGKKATDAALVATESDTVRGGGGGSGRFTSSQFGMAVERIDGYLQAMQKRTGSVGPSHSPAVRFASYEPAPARESARESARAYAPRFSPAELQALGARAPELRELLAELKGVGVTCRSTGCDASSTM